MKINVGDKVRIKTWDVLAVEGIVIDKRQIQMKDSDFTMDFDEMGKVQNVVKVDDTDNTFYNGTYWNPISAIAEVIPQTLDEYICGLSLEERARWFVCYSGNPKWWSTITEIDYDSYEEALQATIEALKQPKE